MATTTTPGTSTSGPSPSPRATLDAGEMARFTVGTGFLPTRVNRWADTTPALLYAVLR